MRTDTIHIIYNKSRTRKNIQQEYTIHLLKKIYNKNYTAIVNSILGCDSYQISSISVYFQFQIEVKFVISSFGSILRSREICSIAPLT